LTNGTTIFFNAAPADLLVIEVVTVLAKASQSPRAKKKADAGRPKMEKTTAPEVLCWFEAFELSPRPSPNLKKTSNVPFSEFSLQSGGDCRFETLAASLLFSVLQPTKPAKREPNPSAKNFDIT
jgi:hypothetical protein